MLEEKAAKAKGLAAKGVLAHYLASGLGVGSVLLVLYGAWSLLSRTLDPGFAALGLGLGLIATLVLGVVVATRPKKPEVDG